MGFSNTGGGGGAVALAPADYGLKAWTFDPQLGAVGASPVAAGVVHSDVIKLPSAGLLSQLWILISGTPGVTLANAFAGLYDMAGNLLGATADQSAVWTAVGVFGMPLVTPVTVPAGLYRLAYLIGSAATLPTFGRASAGQGVNFGSLAGASRRNADSGAALAALPNPMTAASLADSVRSTWWGLS